MEVSSATNGRVDSARSLTTWNDTATRRAIVAFVERVTRAGSPHFVPVSARIAVFDNDGTLWCEHPLPIQADFLLRRLAQMAADDPTLRDRQPWKAAVENDFAWLRGVITKHYRGDDTDLRTMSEGLLRAYAGSSIESFESAADAFLQSAVHPRLGRRYVECVYAPMIELLGYLAANGFTSYIASGGSRDFMRPVTQGLYGVPPDRVIGSTVALEYRDDGAVAEILHRPDLDIFDDGPAKPVRIWSRVGARPIFAAGNSNGDLEMLHFVEHPSRPSMSVLVAHDDAAREFAYDAGAEKVTEVARAKGWCMVSIKDDWRSVFPPVWAAFAK